MAGSCASSFKAKVIGRIMSIIITVAIFLIVTACDSRSWVFGTPPSYKVDFKGFGIALLAIATVVGISIIVIVLVVKINAKRRQIRENLNLNKMKRLLKSGNKDKAFAYYAYMLKNDNYVLVEEAIRFLVELSGKQAIPVLLRYKNSLEIELTKLSKIFKTVEEKYDITEPDYIGYYVVGTGTREIPNPEYDSYGVNSLESRIQRVSDIIAKLENK